MEKSIRFAKLTFSTHHISEDPVSCLVLGFNQLLAQLGSNIKLEAIYDAERYGVTFTAMETVSDG